MWVWKPEMRILIVISITGKTTNPSAIDDVLELETNVLIASKLIAVLQPLSLYNSVFILQCYPGAKSNFILCLNFCTISDVDLGFVQDYD